MSIKTARVLAAVLPLMMAAPDILQAQGTQAQGAPDPAPAPPTQMTPTQLAAPPPAAAPNQPVETYSKAQLDQMLAPIALYPDQLLIQVLMASTYTVDVVEASRWLDHPENAALRGDALATALQPLSWAPSVKALVPFPQIVKELNDHLDWAQSLGAAFVNEQAQVDERSPGAAPAGRSERTVEDDGADDGRAQGIGDRPGAGQSGNRLCAGL